MKKLKSSLAILVCTLIASAALSSCSSPAADPNDPNSTTPPTVSDKIAQPLLNVNGTDTAIENIMTIEGIPVPYDLYRYYYIAFKKSAESNLGENVWNDTPDMRDNLLSEVLTTIRNSYAVEKLAEEYDCLPTEEEIAALDEQIAENMTYMQENVTDADGNPGTVEDALNYFSLSSYELYSDLYKSQVLYENVYQKLFGDDGSGPMSKSTDELEQTVRENYVHVKHILFKISDDGSDVTSKRETAEEVLQQLRDGADFDEMISLHNEDPGMESLPDGYTFTYNQMVTPFEDASFALAENEISDIVETEYGYHIILKLPLTDEGIQTTISELLPEVNRAEFLTFLQDYTKDYNIDYSPEYQFISVENVK